MGETIDIFEELGVKKIINAAGTMTELGGSLMSPEVLEVMASASRSFVDMHELHLAAGRRIADYVGVPAAHVCGGASAGMALMACACMTGGTPSKIRCLPNAAGMRNCFAVQKAHRSPFDRAILLAGGCFLEVLPKEKDLEQALGKEGIAGLFHTEAWFCSRQALALEHVAEISHRYGLPVIVDAAAELPPARNLRAFLELGADLVVFSGGKAMRGPQGTGLIVGRPDLVEACRLNDSPHMAIGRSMKVSKEEIAGLVKAVELYVARDHDSEMELWEKRVSRMIEILRDIPGIRIARQMPRGPGQKVPHVVLRWKEEELGVTCRDLVQALREGTPSIAVHLVHPEEEEGADFILPEIRIQPHTLESNDAEIVAQRIKAFHHTRSGV